MQSTALRVLTAASWLMALSPGCGDSDSSSSGNEDAAPTPPVPPTSPPGRKCGTGAPSITLGQDHPFTPLAAPVLPIQTGSQGGFHLEVSLRVTGPLDPNETDVRLEVWTGDWKLSSHVNTATLLGTLVPDVCDYDVARLVLVDELGMLLSPDRVQALPGTEVELRVRLQSAPGEVADTFQVTLGDINAGSVTWDAGVFR
jgi:hypothetical protein